MLIKEQGETVDPWFTSFRMYYLIFFPKKILF